MYINYSPHSFLSTVHAMTTPHEARAIHALAALERRLPVVAGTEKWAYPTPVDGAVVADQLAGVLVQIKRCARRCTYRVEGRVVSLAAALAAVAAGFEAITADALARAENVACDPARLVSFSPSGEANPVRAVRAVAARSNGDGVAGYGADRCEAMANLFHAMGVQIDRACELAASALAILRESSPVVVAAAQRCRQARATLDMSGASLFDRRVNASALTAALCAYDAACVADERDALAALAPSGPLKLHVLRAGQWLPVFARVNGAVVTCEATPAKALPPKALWAEDDLAYFRRTFANETFELRRIP